MKSIVFFNHKGGVSKTTNVFYFGWTLADMGYKVLMVDADPQCNLTGLTISKGDFNVFEKFYKDHPDRNIKAGLRPVFEGLMSPLASVEPVKIDGRPGLYLLPGHLQFSEYDVTMTLAHELTSSVHALKNVPGASSALIQLTAASVDADIVLIDLNPSLSAINQNILLTSDHFVIPNSPDYFSLMAIKSLTRILPRWAAWQNLASQHPILKAATYPLRAAKSKFAGALVQNFRLRSGAPTVGFKDQINVLADAVQSSLVPALKASGMLSPASKYSAATARAPAYFLGMVPNFNTLSAKSHAGSTPVFALTKAQIGHVGTVLAQNIKKRNSFKRTYVTMAKKLLQAIS